jgi:hypothetical protein
MKTKLYDLVRTTVSEVVEVAKRNAYEDSFRRIQKNIYKLEREFQRAVHETNLVLCGQLRKEINGLKSQLKAL